MKFHFFLRRIFLNASFAFLLPGCAPATDSPRAAFEVFQSSLDSNDIRQFRILVTADTVSAAAVARDSGIVTGDILELLLERYRSCSPYRVTGVSINGDDAEVSVGWKDPADGELKVGTFTLIKVNSQWRVDLSNDVAAWVETLKWLKDVDRKLQDSVPDGLFPDGL